MNRTSRCFSCFVYLFGFEFNGLEQRNVLENKEKITYRHRIGQPIRSRPFGSPIRIDCCDFSFVNINYILFRNLPVYLSIDTPVRDWGKSRWIVLALHCIL